MASAFLGPLTIREVDDVFFQVVDSPFSYQSDVAKETITVPVGFLTDFASVPRIGWLFSVLGDIAHQPAIIHDWLYYSGLLQRDLADKVFLEAMSVVGISALKRWPIYWGVRLGGFNAWDTHRKLGHTPETLKYYAELPIALKKDSK